MADVQPLARLSVTCIAEDKGSRQQGSYGGGGRHAFAFLLEGDRHLRFAREAARQAIVNLDASGAPAGEMTVVLGPGWPGILLHEAIGHGLEGDFNRKGTSAFTNLLGANAWPPSSAPWSTMGRCRTGEARSTSTTKAPPRSAPF